ncbi:hypothetical protein ACSBR2_024515 [Camellia fascicularis]
MLYSNVTSISIAIFHLLPSLRCIVNTTFGLNHIDLEKCRSCEIVVSYAKDVFSKDVSDMTVGLLIDVLKQITASNRYIHGGFLPIKGGLPS